MKKENKFVTFIEKISDVIFSLNMDFEFTNVSPAVFSLKDLHPDEILGKSIRETLTENSWEILVSAVSKELKEEGNTDKHRAIVLELEMIRRDGSTIWTEVKASFLRDDHGTPIGILGIARDISKCKLEEAERRKIETLLQLVLNNAPITIFTLDLEGRFTVSEGKGLKRTGLKPGENVGTSALDLYDSMIYEKYDGSEITASDIIESAFAGESVDAINELNGIYFNNHIGPIRDSCGEIIGIVGVATDITELKQIEKTLTDSQKLMENVYSSLEEAVFVIDPNTQLIISCNRSAEKMFGYSQDEMIGRSKAFIYGNKKQFREFENNLYPALDAEGIFYTKFQMRKKDGTVFPTSHTVNEVRDNNGNRTIVISVIRDITIQNNLYHDLARKRRELEAKSKRLEETNIALKVLLDQHNEEKANFERDLMQMIDLQLLPILDRVKKTGLNTVQIEYLNILESSIKKITNPFQHDPSTTITQLSPSEIEIAMMVREGFRTKEIASSLSVSTRTVESHRANIRKKLGIKNQNTCLKTFLSSLR